MFFIKPKSKVSSKSPNLPTRIAAKYLKPTCLLVLIIFLVVVQLRAIELSALNESHRIAETTTSFDLKKIPEKENSTTSFVEAKTGQQQIGIDRHDFIVEDKSTTTTTAAPNIGKSVVQQSSGQLLPVEEVLVGPSSASAAHTEATIGRPNGETLDDLLVAPATHQVQSVDGATSAEQLQQPAAAIALTRFEDDVWQQLPVAERQMSQDLRNAEAIGTQTGLLVRDLMSRASGQSASSTPYALGEQSRQQFVEEAPQQFNVPRQVGNVLPLATALISRNQPETEDEVEPTIDDDEDGAQAAGRRLSEMQVVGGSRSDLASDSGAAPESPGEEQMPDSIESLMADSGENLADDDGRQQMAGLDEQEDPSQQVAGSNLVNQQPVGESLQNLRNEEDDDDEDDDANIQAAPNGQQLLNGQSVPVLTSTRYVNQAAFPVAQNGVPEMRRTAALRTGVDHTLVAPMRDTLSDLNAAAGHYYGKKKKKKVKKVKKKIVIKKKKKKKKKKYVKVKVVKKYKKKKVAKKKPKKMHHYDHGKYYMYAKVPKKKSWEFGFKKGNKKHWIERHEKGHKNKFKTKVKWYDKKSKGKGLHIWDYNHHDKKKKKKHY